MFWLREFLDVISSVVYVLIVLPKISMNSAVFFSSLMFGFPLTFRLWGLTGKIPRLVYLVFGLMQIACLGIENLKKA